MREQIPDGVFPTMITPFTSRGTIDYDAVSRLIGWYDARGVSGIFAICQSSEIFFLSFEERLELLRFVVANAPKHISIIASGHVESDLDTQIKEAAAFIETGIDAYVFISNRFAREDESDDVLIKNALYVMDNLPLMNFGIYECPYPYKRVMSPEALKTLAASGRLRFLKDTCCDLDLISRKLSAAEGNDLKIYNAVSSILLESLKMGCSGYSGVMANFHPELYVWLCENYRSEPEKSMLLQDFLGVASVMESRFYPVCAKYFLNISGVTMDLYSRARNSSEFSRNFKMEFDQLKRLTDTYIEQMEL